MDNSVHTSARDKNLGNEHEDAKINEERSEALNRRRSNLKKFVKKSFDKQFHIRTSQARDPSEK
jgi:hypothetical protein